MSVRFYHGVDYKHTQENAAFRLLCSAAQKHLTGDAVIIVNVKCGKYELDALVLKNNAVIIVDFKDYGGTVRINPESQWITNEKVIIRGGNSYTNPYKQVEQYRVGLRSWLNTKNLLPYSMLSHISGLVMFTRPISIDKDAEFQSIKWFRAADQEGALDFIRDQVSNKVELSEINMTSIVEALKAKPFPLHPSDTWMPPSQIERVKEQAAREAVFVALQDEDDRRMQEWELARKIHHAPVPALSMLPRAA